MKHLLLAATLVGCIVACNTTDKKSVSDPATPTAPKAECSAEKGTCPGAAGECTGEKKSCCSGVTKPQG